jgi:hypothetical protein
VTGEAVAIKSDRNKSSYDHHESDCDDSTNTPELGRIDLVSASDTDESAEADENTRDFSNSNEQLNILCQRRYQPNNYIDLFDQVLYKNLFE